MKMVARIKTPKAIVDALDYNERKVTKGVAELLSASRFLKDMKDLGYHEKLEGFTRLIERNSSKTNSLHISLNFSNEDVLDKEKMVQIADDYMQQIGFGQQPYLVYRHHDSGHPHLHIVTTSIQANGKRIDTYRIGVRRSEKARKQIEIEYGLVKAEGRGQKQSARLKAANLKRAMAGKGETKKEIQDVLDAVLASYRFRSLEELNAVLRQCNVWADRGSEESTTYKKNGLLYFILDEKGKPATTPIKASLFHDQPTLAFLEKRFKEHALMPKAFKDALKLAIDQYFLSKNSSLPGLLVYLEQKGIYTVLRQNEEGIIYGITYVDNNNRCVLNGSALGKPYAAKGILERCGLPPLKAVQVVTQNIPADRHLKNPGKEHKDRVDNLLYGDRQHSSNPNGTGILENVTDALLQTEYINEILPFQLRRTRKKKKRKRPNS